MKYIIIILSLCSLWCGLECGKLDNSLGEDSPVWNSVYNPSPLAVTCNSTGPVCQTSCDDLPDGLYQFCGNCTTFVICSAGTLYYGECPDGLRFDNREKGCVEVSHTCHECYVAPKCETTGPKCIYNCSGQTDGQHQYCANCTSYAVCDDEVMTIEPCPQGMIWDDNEKGCALSSSTCVECFAWTWCNSTGPSCIESCEGRQDGRYQSCDNCVQFAQCTDGELELDFCSVGMFWDDNRLGCFVTSQTCQHCVEPNLCDSTGEVCISRCQGLNDGYYQACANCTSYIQCQAGRTSYIHCTTPNWVWDHAARSCLPASSTCTECFTSGCQTGPACVSTCDDEPDGYYQLCHTCASFAVCVSGDLDTMDCPPGLVWHDDAKVCDQSPSTTCTECPGF